MVNAAEITADRAEAYHRLRRELRAAKALPDELDNMLKEQWWEDVKPLFGHPGVEGWWLTEGSKEINERS